MGRTLLLIVLQELEVEVVVVLLVRRPVMEKRVGVAVVAHIVPELVPELVGLGRRVSLVETVHPSPPPLTTAVVVEVWGASV